MSDLENTNLIDLVPSSIKKDEQIKAAVAGIDPELKSVSSSIQFAELYSRIDELSEPVLKMLAWENRVYSYEWALATTIEAKRNLVKNSFELNKRRGTRWAIERIFELLNIDATIQEWFEYGGQPYRFKVNINTIDGRGLTEEELNTAYRMIDVYKPLRCSVERIGATLVGEDADFNAGASSSYIGVLDAFVDYVPPPPPELPSTPYIWFDASDASTFTLDGADVDGWESKGDYAFTISPLNAAKPQKVGDSVFFDNDPNVVGVSPAMLYGGDFPVADNGFYWTHFVVISEVVSGSMYQVPVARGISSTGSVIYQYTGLRTSDSIYYTLFRSNAILDSTVVSGPTDFSPKRLIRSDFTTTGIGIDLDGGQYSNFKPANVAVGSLLDRMFIGGERKSSASFNANAFAGKVHEVLLYNRALTPQEIDEVNAYLNYKWFIY